MKRIFIALMVAMTFCSLAMAQNQTITQNNNDSSDSTFVAEYTDIVDSSTVDTDYQSSSFDFGNEFPFNMGKGAINGGILTGLIVVILIFGFPFFIVFVAFYFRYKNRKAKYKLMEQALATGQPLPEGIFKDSLPQDYRNRTVHLPLDHHRRIQHRMYRIAGVVHRNRAMDHLTQPAARTPGRPFHNSYTQRRNPE